jgi:hypothetical protein
MCILRIEKGLNLEKILKLIRDLGLDKQDSYQLFIPSFGIGDRVRYYSYIEEFEKLTNLTAYILDIEGHEYELIQYFPSLAQKSLINLPASYTYTEEEIKEYIKQKKHFTLPTNNPFPTWHHAYNGGILGRWEFLNRPEVNHDLAVKHSLQLPYCSQPTKVSLKAPLMSDTSNEVVVAPYCNSNVHYEENFWLAVCSLLVDKGLEPVINKHKGTRTQVHHTEYELLQTRYKTISVSLSALIDYLCKTRGIVCMASGLSVFFSLSTIPCISISHSGISRFWDNSYDTDTFIDLRETTLSRGYLEREVDRLFKAGR